MILGLAAICLAAAPAWAHDQPYSYLDLRFPGDRLEGRLTAHIVDLTYEAALDAPESLLTESGVRARLAAIEKALVRQLDVEVGGRRVMPTWDGFEIERDRKRVAFRWHAALGGVADTIRVRGPIFHYDPQHETYLNVYQDGSLRQQDLLAVDRVESVVVLAAREPPWDVARRFVGAGIHHIFIGPDHILFIVGLLLLGGGVRRLLMIVTAFTVAHSITLALAAFGILTPSPRIIEPAIAASIVCVGVENLRRRDDGRDPRALLAFLFGFAHGFGFASVLRDFGLPRSALGLSLFSFNVGVEIGQACIVLAVSPLLAWVRGRDPRVAQRVVVMGSWLVIAAGSYWLVQRVITP